MTKIETEFLMTLQGTRLRLALGETVCEMASNRLKLDPSKCHPVGTSGFQWIDVSADHSPIDRSAYIGDVLRRRRGYLEKEYWGPLFRMLSCHITIDNVRFCYRVDDRE